jgi:hypothetical protein
MHTVKQLSVEEIILNKYSTLMYQTVTLVYIREKSLDIFQLFYRLYKKYALLFTIPYGLFWIIDSFTTALLYYYALVRLENNQFTFNDITM